MTYENPSSAHEIRTESQTQRQAWTIGADREDLLHGLGHELGAQLRHILGFSQLLEQDLSERLSQDEAQWLQYVLGSARVAQAMVEGLRRIVRAGEAKRSALSVGDLAAIIDSEGSGALESSGFQVSVDTVCFSSAIRELVNNADEYGGGAKRVSHRIAGSTVEFTVSNTRATFEESDFHQGCRLFARLDDKLTEAHVGVGLTLARAVAQAHQGELTWRSAAELTLSIPLVSTGRSA